MFYMYIVRGLGWGVVDANAAPVPSQEILLKPFISNSFVLKSLVFRTNVGSTWFYPTFLSHSCLFRTWLF